MTKPENPFSLKHGADDDYRPRKPVNWRRRFIWLGGVLAVLSLCLWIFINSAFFFRGIVLPRIAHSLNAEINAGQVDWSLTSGITLGEVSLITTGEKPLIEAARIEIDCSAWDLWNGRIGIKSVALTAPLINIELDTEGNSNLDPLIDALRKKSGNPSSKWYIRNISIREGQISYRTPEAKWNFAELSADLDQISPDETGVLQIKALAQIDNKVPCPAEAKLEFTLNGEGQWESSKASAKLKLPNGLNAEAAGKIHPDHLEQFILQFKMDDHPRGRLLANGMRDPNSGDWRFQLNFNKLDGAVLEPLLGIDFGATQFNATNSVHLAYKEDGFVATIAGGVRAMPFTIVRGEVVTPPINLYMQYNCAVDSASSILRFDRCNIAGNRQQHVLLESSLKHPLRLNWDAGKFNLESVAFKLNLNEVDLSQWGPLLTSSAKSGRLSLALDAAQSVEEGPVKFQVRATGLEITGDSGQMILKNENISINANGEWADDLLKIDEGSLDHVSYPEPDRRLSTVLDNIDLSIHLAGKGTDYQMSSRWERKAGKDIASGRLESNGTFVLSNNGTFESIQAEGSVQVENSAGVFKDAKDFSANLMGHWTTKLLKNFTANFHLNGKPVGRIESRGKLNLVENKWILNTAINNVDRNVLNFLGSGKGLDFRDTVLNATNQIRLSPDAREWSVKGHINANKFSIIHNDAPSPPMELEADYDLEVNWLHKTARLDRLTLDGTRGNKKVLDSRLVQPMQLDWSDNSTGVSESKLEIKLSEFDFAEWRPLLGGPIRAGDVNAILTVASRPDGKHLDYELNATGHGFIATQGQLELSNAEVTLASKGTVAGLKSIDLTKYEIGWQSSGHEAWSLAGGGIVVLDGNSTISLQNLGSQLKVGSNPVGNLVLTGVADLASQRGWMDFNIQNVSEKLIQPLWPEVSFKVGLLAAKANTNGTIRISHGDLTEVNATFGMLGVRLADSDGLQPMASFKWVGRFDGAIRKAGEHWGIRVDRCKGVVSVGDEVAGNFLLKGEVTLGPEHYEADLRYTDLKNIRKDFIRLVRLDRVDQRIVDLETLSYIGRTQLYTGGRVGLNGRINLNGLHLRDPQGSFQYSPLDIECDAKIAVQIRSGVRWDVNATKIGGNISSGENKRGTFEVNGWYLAKDGKGNVECQFKDLDQDMVRPFLEGSMPPEQLHQALVTGNIMINIDPDAGFTFTGSADVASWQVHKPGSEPPSRPLNGTLEFNLNRHRKLLTIRKLGIQLTKTEYARNSLQLSGWLNFSREGHVSGGMKMDSESVDIDSILRALPAIPTSGKKRELDIRYALKADKIHWRGLSAEDFNGTLKLHRNETVISPMQMTLEGGRVYDTHLTVNRSTRPFNYDLKFKGLKMRANPVLSWLMRDHFWTQQANWGHLDAFMRLKWYSSGAGKIEFTEILGLEEMASFLGADAELGRDSACLKISGAEVLLAGGEQEKDTLIPSLIKLSINGLALALGVPELNKAKMNSALLIGRVENRKCELEMILDTPMYAAKTADVIALHDPLGGSPINLPVQVTLKLAVAKQFKILGDLLRRDTPETLPVFLHLVGTLGKYDKKVDDLKVANIYASSLIGKITNVPTEIIGRIPFPLNPFRRNSPPKPPKK